MRILLDECVPRRAAREFIGHSVRTVQEMGWSGKRNGDLLAVAQAEFDAMVTVASHTSVSPGDPAGMAVKEG